MAIKCVLCYLNGTSTHGVLLEKYDVVDLVGFRDIDSVDSSDDWKST